METTFFRSLEEIVAPEHTAVVVIDVQNEFCSPGGYFHKHNDMLLVKKMMPNLVRFLAGCRERALKIAYFVNLYDPSQFNGPTCERWHRLGIKEEYCVADTWGGAVCDTVAPQPGEPVFPKNTYSGLTSAGFRSWLGENGIKTLILTGVSTNICVESTARQAFMDGFYVVVVEDCVAAYTEDEQRIALKNIKGFFGNVVLSHEILNVL